MSAGLFPCLCTSLGDPRAAHGGMVAAKLRPVKQEGKVPLMFAVWCLTFMLSLASLAA